MLLFFIFAFKNFKVKVAFWIFYPKGNLIAQTKQPFLPKHKLVSALL